MTIKVEAPDGTVVEFPDGTDDEIITSVMSQNFGGPQKQPRADYESTAQYAKDAARAGLGQGTLLGFGDEIVAGARYAGGQLGLTDEVTYDDALAEEREAVARFREKNPLTSLALEVTGGFALPGGAVLGSARSAKTLGGAMLRGAGVGAGFGAAAGFGTGQGGVENRATNAVTGAGLGAGIGAAVPGAVGAVRGLRSAGEAVIRRGTGSRLAARRAFGEQVGGTEGLRKINRELLEQADARANISPNQAPIQNTTNIADVSDTASDQLRGINTAFPSTRPTTRARLEGRQTAPLNFRGGPRQGQLGRIDETLRRGLQIEGGSLNDDLAEMTDIQRIMSSGEFRGATERGMSFDISDELDRARQVLSRERNPEFRKELQKAIELFDENPLQGLGRVDNIRDFEQARHALGDVIGSLGRGQGRLRNYLKDLNNRMRDVVAGVEPGSNKWRTAPKQNKGYFDALKNYGTRQELIDIAEEGTKRARDGKKLDSNMFKNMTPAEQRVFRKAWYEEIMAKLDEKIQGKSTDYTGELRRGRVQGELGDISPGNVKQKMAMENIVKGEEAQTRTNQRILGGSQTADKAADAATTVQNLSIAGQLLRNPTSISAWAQAGQALARGAQMSQRQAQYIADELTQMDPQRQQQFLRQVQESLDSRAFGRFQDKIGPMLNRGSASAGAGLGTEAARDKRQPGLRGSTTFYYDAN